MRLARLESRNWRSSRSCVHQALLLLIPLKYSFPAWWFFSHACTNQYYAKHLRRTLAGLWGSLCMQLSSFWHSVLSTVVALISHLWVFSSWSRPGSALFPLPALWSENSTNAVFWGSLGLAPFVLSLRDH